MKTGSGSQDIFTLFLRRLAARSIDFILFFGAVGLVIRALVGHNHDSRAIAFWVGLGLFMVYESVLLVARGATVGKNILGLSVRGDAGHPKIGQAVFRTAIIFGFPLQLVPVIGVPIGALLSVAVLVTSMFGPRSGVQDILARTQIVREARGWFGGSYTHD